MAQQVKNLPAVQAVQMQVPSLVGTIPCKRKLQPTPVFLPGKSYKQGNLAGYSPKGHKELDMTEHISTHKLYYF